MKGGHVLLIVGVGAVLLYFGYRWSGAASNCGFWDAITGKCGVS
jgi:hypothetical protein